MTIDLLKSKIIEIKKDITPSERAILCRECLESAVEYIFETSGVDLPKKATLLELIDSQVVTDYVYTAECIPGLHYVRKLGMNAKHEKSIKKKEALLALDTMEYLIGFLSDKAVGLEASYKKPKYMTEAETRRLYIDMYLKEAGWEVLDKENMMLPGTAGIEIKVDGMPNEKKEGYCDYVLYGKDGTPLAIVEAKKTSVDPQVGRHQVDLYGDCMKLKYGKKPILYYTNGYEINVIDGIYPDRQVMAFHSIDELELMSQQQERLALESVPIDEHIINRPYQKMALTKVFERLTENKRRSLLVMATGTGKTRVAIAMVDVLLRANWVKNVLFLADRTALVNQAKRNFEKYLPQMPVCELSGNEEKNYNAHLMFSTYQTMINYIDAEDKRFTSGRFDLIIIDEAHRSIFNKYGAIFKYFDSFIVGLTATPKDEIGKSTYSLLQCENGEPNFEYSLNEAIQDKYLVGYQVINKESKFLREGIRYSDLTEDEREQLDDYLDNDEHQEDIVIESSELYKTLFNIDMCNKVIEDLMNNGLRVDGGETLGKSIIFAYNHTHADMIVKCFKNLYPQYPSNTCQLIDYSVNYSDDLILKFENDPEFRIAVSVDKLDTGIDVNAILNLVFFKPVKSNIKFIQMIGRGTRLCDNLYGPGKNKTGFLIFDYCNNFEYFSMNPNGIVNENESISVTRRLFETRLDILLELQRLEYQEDEYLYGYYKELKDKLHKEIVIVKSHDNRISVREKMMYVDKYYDLSAWTCLSAVNVKEIKKHLGCLIDTGLEGQKNELSFDNKMLKVELSILAIGGINRAIKEIKDIRQIASYLIKEKASIPQVKEKAKELKQLMSEQLWDNPSVNTLEELRKKVRELMVFVANDGKKSAIVDIDDDITDSDFHPDSTMIDIRTYKEKVVDYLCDHLDNPVLKKIQNLEPINNEDLIELEKILWKELGTKEEYEETTEIDNVAVFVRSLIGLSQEAVNDKFGEYLFGNSLNSNQQEFLKTIINYVRENGDVSVEDMVNTEPFNNFDLTTLFGTSISVLVNVVNTLHNTVNAA